MNKGEEVHAEGANDPEVGQQAWSASSQESEESKKGKRSPFLGAKDAFKKFVKSGPSRSSNTKVQLRETTCDLIENPQGLTKRNLNNNLYKTNPFRSRTRPGSENVSHQPKKPPNSTVSDAKERRSRWNRGKGATPAKQIVGKKPMTTEEEEAYGKDISKKEATVVKTTSRYKPPQNPTELDVESVSDLLRMMGITIEGKLGEGTYAKVRSAFNNRQGKRVALKIVSRARLNSRFQRKFLPRELSILKSIKHANIIELYQVIEKKDTIIMVMELARHGDLLEYIQKKKALPSNEARTIFSHILNAVEYLHLNGFFHRDLKCENVLLDWAPTGIVAKITDFGFARDWCEAYRLCRTYCGSAAYASPEILQGIPYDPHGTDIWSIGVILFIMITGRMPYDDSNITDSLSCMMNNTLDWPNKRPVCREVKDLLSSILRYELRERATVTEIRRSAWMEGRIERVKFSAPKVTASKHGKGSVNQELSDRSEGSRKLER